MRLVSQDSWKQQNALYKATRSFYKLMPRTWCLLISKGTDTPKKREASTTCLDKIQTKLWQSIHKTISQLPTCVFSVFSFISTQILGFRTELYKFACSCLSNWNRGASSKNGKTGTTNRSVSLGSIQQLLIFSVDHGKPRFFWSAHMPKGSIWHCSSSSKSQIWEVVRCCAPPGHWVVPSKALTQPCRDNPRPKAGIPTEQKSLAHEAIKKKVGFFPPDF